MYGAVLLNAHIQKLTLLKDLYMHGNAIDVAFTPSSMNMCSGIWWPVQACNCSNRRCFFIFLPPNFFLVKFFGLLFMGVSAEWYDHMWNMGKHQKEFLEHGSVRWNSEQWQCCVVWNLQFHNSLNWVPNQPDFRQFPPVLVFLDDLLGELCRKKLC